MFQPEYHDYKPRKNTTIVRARYKGRIKFENNDALNNNNASASIIEYTDNSNDFNKRITRK